jgi:hypothetical protein
MDQISAELDALPGVLAVSRSGPFWDGTRLSRLWVADQEVRTPVRWLPVARDYFDTVRIPLLSGRGLLSGDSAPPRVAIVEQALADRLFGGANPLGRRFALSRGGSELEIVGVAGDTRMPGDQEARPTIYLPEGTRPSDFSSPGREERMAAYGLGYNTGFQVRTAQDPMAMLPAIRDAVALVEADLPLLDPKTVSQGFRERLEPTRLFAFVCLSFGGVALLLTAVGLYGLVAYSVSQRTREIGIRTALGATRYGIVRLVTARTAALLGFGLAAGAAGAAVVGQLARAHIFGVTVYDPPTYASAAVLLVMVALAAAFVPARRAVRVDPNLALRQE